MAKEGLAARRQAAMVTYNAKHFTQPRPTSASGGGALARATHSHPRTGAGLPARAGEAHSAPSDDESSEGDSDDYGL